MSGTDTKFIFASRTIIGLLMAAVALSACSGESTRLAGTATPVAREVDTFGFELGRGRCDVPDPSHCDGRRAGKWTTDERAAVGAAVAEIASKPLGRALITAAQARGARALRRYDVGLVPRDERPLVTAETINALFYRGDPREPFVEIFDRYFEQRYRDRSSGSGFQARILLHELFHVVDDGGSRYSSADNFRTAVGFTRDWLPPLLSDDLKIEQARVATRVNDLATVGRPDEAWEVGRAFARRFSMPSMRSMHSAKEGFAELGTHIVLGGEPLDYLKPAVREYFDTVVFAPLRGQP